MDIQLKKGLLDACVLSVLSHGESYGYKLSQDISLVMEISESTLYPVLRRMEQQGFLSTHNSVHNGRLRKYYLITPVGKGRLVQFRAEWADVKRVVDYVLEDGGER